MYVCMYVLYRVEYILQIYYKNTEYMGNTAAGQNDLKIQILTGQAQSLQLFDFHSSLKKYSVSDLKFPSIIGLEDGEIVYKEVQSQNSNPEFQAIYRIELNNFRDIIIRELFQRPQDNQQSLIWKVLGQGEMMQLQQGDALKIGKTKVVFKEIVNVKPGNAQLNRNTVSMLSDRSQTQRMDVTHVVQPAEAKTGEGQCRLCFDNIQTISNPLVSLCKCSGSVKYIHYECLKDWISNNIKKQKSPNCLSYSYLEPTCCQLCKQQISKQFMLDGQKYSLYQFQKIQPPYAIFQNRFYDQQANKFRVAVYNISVPQNTEVSIGRNHSSHVILRDISVSRNHCNLIYKHGSLFIQDKKSKFGTLVCPKKGFEFDSVNGLQLQFQSKVIQILQQKAFNSCCCAENHSYFVEINKGVNDKTF